MSDQKSLAIRQATEMALAARKRIAAVRERVEENNKRFESEQAAFSSKETHLIFAVDATASRKDFWEQTKIIQNEMFASVEGAGTNLTAQLVSYSGFTHGKDIYASPWHDSAFVLREHMAGISCEAGGTQIAKVFRHALKECCSRPVHALVLVVDSCEEQEHELTPLAQDLKKRNIKLFLFDDEERSGARHTNTPVIFKAVTRSANGIYAPFDMQSLDVLEDYLKTVAVVATGNTDAVERMRGEVRTPKGRTMLEESIRLLGLPPSP